MSALPLPRPATLVLDTETTGLRAPDGRSGRLVQVGWVRVEPDGRTAERSLLVRPEGFAIPADATAVHGITTARALAEGVPLAEALAALAEAAAGAARVAAHNAAFDLAVVADEARRAGVPNPLAGLPSVCTMELGTPVCALPHALLRGRFKWPTLAELHAHLFGAAPDGQHDALADARATARCLARLERVPAPAADRPAEPAAPGAAAALPPPPPLSAHQAEAFAQLTRFLGSREPAFALTGYAGTGKTTLLRHLADHLRAAGRPFHVLTPTGRAARVARERTGAEAQTIHSHLYGFLREETDDDAPPAIYFGLRTNDAFQPTVYLVDEASMLGDQKAAGTDLHFGSGRLLTDLFAYTKIHDRGAGHHVVFVGDPAQLWPVKAKASPALSPAALRAAFGVEADAATLTEVHRQGEGSGILALATALRACVEGGSTWPAPQAPSPEVTYLGIDKDADVLTRYLQAVRQDGFESAIIITHMNKTVAEINQVVREKLWKQAAADLLVPGERLLVTRNNLTSHLLNGDIVTLREKAAEPVRRTVNGVELVWREITVQSPHHADPVRTLLFESDFHLGLSELSPKEAAREHAKLAKALAADFKIRHRNLTPDSPEFAKAKAQDPFVQALRVNYGYAVTCHKAQGGEWPLVLVVFDGCRRTDARWAYTAATRAGRELVLSNPPWTEAPRSAASARATPRPAPAARRADRLAVR